MTGQIKIHGCRTAASRVAPCRTFGGAFARSSVPSVGPSTCCTSTGLWYVCYNQTRYLTKNPTPKLRAVGFDWTLYEVMAGERARVSAYRRDIEATVRGKTVLEIGAGPTAVFTRIAAESGAALVVSVEANAWVADEARRWVRRFGSRVEVLAAYLDDLDPAESSPREFCLRAPDCWFALASPLFALRFHSVGLARLVLVLMA